jgi:hypothetical protein
MFTARSTSALNPTAPPHPATQFLGNGSKGPAYVRVSVQPVVNFARLDQPTPLTRALGADGAALYVAKLRTMVVGGETDHECRNCHRYVPELGFGMPAPGK